MPGTNAESGQAAVVGDRPSAPSGRRRNLWWLLSVGVVTAALCLPFLRTVYWLGDEGILLHGAERILHGSRLYADFFEFLPPGGFVLTAAWFRIAGISILSARSLAILTIVGIACFTYLACQRVSKNAPLSALFTIGWVVMSQGAWTVVSHHWFTTLFSMIAAWAALSSIEDGGRGLRWPLIAGAAAGMAAMVMETQGALVMTAALLASWYPWQRPAGLVAYLFGCALAPVGLFAYMVGSHTLVSAFKDVILFPAEHYASIQGVPFGSSDDLQSWPLKYLFAVAIVLTVVISIRNQRLWRQDRTLWLCAAFGVAGFVNCFPRPDIFHIAFVAPLALPLLLFCMADLLRWRRPAYRYVIIGLVIVLAAPSANVYLWRAEQAQEARIVQTPRGRIAVPGLPGVGRLLQQIAATPPGDAYFFYPYLPMMPFLTARRDVSRYDIFTPDYTLPSQYQKACISVMQHASWVVIDRQWTDPKFLKALFPAIENPRPPETRRFERSLDSGFKLVATDGTFELRRRQAGGVGSALCDRIAR
jgi:hypothetical protein